MLPVEHVVDFYGSLKCDRHYVLDRLTGEIRFGDGQRGMIPPLGLNNIRLSYRSGGGTQGNRNSQTVTNLKTTDTEFRITQQGGNLHKRALYSDIFP